jgi:hypothetical protein
MADYTGQTTMLREALETLAKAGFASVQVEVFCAPDKAPTWTVKASKSLDEIDLVIAKEAAKHPPELV